MKMISETVTQRFQLVAALIRRIASSYTRWLNSTHVIRSTHQQAAHGARQKHTPHPWDRNNMCETSTPPQLSQHKQSSAPHLYSCFDTGEAHQVGECHQNKQQCNQAGAHTHTHHTTATHTHTRYTDAHPPPPPNTHTLRTHARTSTIRRTTTTSWGAERGYRTPP